MMMICIVCLVVFFFNNHCSYGDVVPTWMINTNPTLIEECLRKSLQHVSFRPPEDINLADASNIVCETQLDNGLLIKITFDFQEQTWQCFLYKSVIQILNIRFEKCKLLEKEELAVRIQQQQIQAEKENEARIDQLSKQNPGEIHLNTTMNYFNSSIVNETLNNTNTTQLDLLDTDDEIDTEIVPVNQTILNNTNDTNNYEFFKSKLDSIDHIPFAENINEMKEEDIEP